MYTSLLFQEQMRLDLLDQDMNHLDVNLLNPIGIPVPRNTNIHVTHILHFTAILTG